MLHSRFREHTRSEVIVEMVYVFCLRVNIVSEINVASITVPESVLSL
jgi:hypothetical protein